VELWVEDEHRLGLQPLTRKGWFPKGQGATVKVQPRYEWMWLYGFVNPQSGNNYYLILPEVNTKLFNLSLKNFAKEQRVKEDNKLIILVIDQSGFHCGKGLKIPKGIVVEYLPPYSPHLQPAEKLWPLTNEPLVNRHFKTIEEMETKQIEACQYLSKQKEYVSNATMFHWWPVV
jgi:transposase